MAKNKKIVKTAPKKWSVNKLPLVNTLNTKGHWALNKMSSQLNFFNNKFHTKPVGKKSILKQPVVAPTHGMKKKPWTNITNTVTNTWNKVPLPQTFGMKKKKKPIVAKHNKHGKNPILKTKGFINQLTNKIFYNKKY